nr:lectin-like protein [uncultured Mediterranean phage uvMED]
MANSYLRRTLGSPTNAKKYTFSVWVKKTQVSLGGSNLYNYLMSYDAGSAVREHIRFGENDELTWYSRDSSSNATSLDTNRKFRDTNGFYHIVCQYDSAQGTASNRKKIYVNGVQETSFSQSGYPAQNLDSALNTNSLPINVGAFGSSSPSIYFNGYMSHASFVDGSIVAPTVFGETDSTSGIWKFKSPSGVTWGNNGFHLKFENSGAMGTDSSGNTNTFTVNGNLRQALDTPSNVYATFNPLDKSGGTVTTFSNGNTTTMHNSGNNGVVTASRSTLGYSSGKWYWEAKCIATGGDVRTGIISMSSTDYATNSNPFTLNEAYNYKQTGQKGSSGDTNVSYGASYTAGDIIGIAHDADNGTLAFYKNGVSQGNAFTSLSTSLTWGAFTTEYNTGKYDYNFGNGFFGTTAITSAGSNGNGSLFEYDVPSGYYALNTKNINTYG